jgi:hypothetical protein
MVDREHFHTACINADGDLVVTEWILGRDGSMRILKSLTLGKASEVSITSGFTVSSIVATERF